MHPIDNSHFPTKLDLFDKNGKNCFVCKKFFANAFYNKYKIKRYFICWECDVIVLDVFYKKYE